MYVIHELEDAIGDCEIGGKPQQHPKLLGATIQTLLTAAKVIAP